METTPNGLPPEAAPIEENHQRFENVRRFITLVRLAWAEETLRDHEDHDRVIRHLPGDSSLENPGGARQIRGFGTPTENNEDVPIRRSEKRTATHREKQVKKIRRNQIEMYRISQNYDSTTNTDTRYQAPERASRGLRKQIREDRRHEQKVVRHTNMLDDRLDRGSAGDTLPGRVRQRRINRARRRVSKLRAKLED